MLFEYRVGFLNLLGVEFVENRLTKKPFDRSKKIAERFVEKALENGLVVWPNVGQADGHHGDLVMVGPPLNIKMSEIQDCVKRFVKTMEAMNWD